MKKNHCYLASNLFKIAPAKVIFLAVLLTNLPFLSKSQQVNYKVLKDDPKDANNLWVYLDPLQMDFGIKNIDGISFNLGLWSTATFKEKIGADVIFRYGWLTLGKLGGTGVEGEKLKSHYQFEMGGFYNLMESTKSSNTTVILSQKSYESSAGRVTQTKSMKVPSTKVMTLGVRAGILSTGSVYGMSKIKSATVDLTSYLNFPSRINYSMSGIYVGLLTTNNHNIIINTDTDGKAAKSKRSRFYVDALILPVSSAKLNGIDYKAAIDPGMFGFRIGWQALPIESRKVNGIDVKTRGSSFGVEAGVRPFDGLYFTGTWSICLLRRKLPALGYVVPASQRNTSE